jgi:uncharacterized protein
MQINVAQLLKANIGTIRNYEVNGVVDIGGNGTDSVVWGNGSLIRTDRGILVKGTLHTEAKVTCSRCLTLFSYPLILNVEEEYFPTVGVVTGASVPVPGEPGCFTIGEQHVLDLTEAVRQYALLAIPMKPLCHQDCAGICSNCGHNLNLGSCDCPTRQVEPRWAALAKLASEQKGTDLSYGRFT